MSRVFLAEETRLGRQVVIKVLPPEMAAGVNVERFQREIQLAARLQHPHIVPLLDRRRGRRPALLRHAVHRGRVAPGQAGPRGRAAGRGGGPDPARGGGRAGLRPPQRRGAPRHQARQRAALRRPRGGHRLRRRQGGERLERQVLAHLARAWRSARRRTWRRSRPPPTRTSTTAPTSTPWARWRTRCSPAAPRSRRPPPQALLAAHVTQAPEPVTRHRPGVPAGAQRASSCAAWRSARPTGGRAPAELLSQLEAAGHARSGGMTPTGTTPAVSSGTEEAIRQSHPVARRRCCSALAAAGGAGRWCTCWSASSACPTGCSTAPIVLLLLGLPIMLLTGHLERRRAHGPRQRPGGRPPRPKACTAGSPGGRRSRAASSPSRRLASSR